MQTMLLLFDPRRQQRHVLDFLETHAIHMVYYSDQETPQTLWSVTIQAQEVEEIATSESLWSRFAIVMNDYLGWPVAFILEFIEQQGHLYAITLPEDILYYAWSPGNLSAHVGLHPATSTATATPAP